MAKSKIVEAIGTVTNKDLKLLTKGSRFHSKKVAKRVLIQKMTYEEAGEPYGMSKQAVYDLLRRIYLKKYGEEYHGKEKDITKDP